MTMISMRNAYKLSCKILMFQLACRFAQTKTEGRFPWRSLVASFFYIVINMIEILPDWWFHQVTMQEGKMYSICPNGGVLSQLLCKWNNWLDIDASDIWLQPMIDDRSNRCETINTLSIWGWIDTRITSILCSSIHSCKKEVAEPKSHFLHTNWPLHTYILTTQWLALIIRKIHHTLPLCIVTYQYASSPLPLTLSSTLSFLPFPSSFPPSSSFLLLSSSYFSFLSEIIMYRPKYIDTNWCIQIQLMVHQRKLTCTDPTRWLKKIWYWNDDPHSN